MRENESDKEVYDSVGAFYDRLTREGRGELDVARVILVDVPPAIARRLEHMEEDLARIGARALSGLILDAGCGNGNVMLRILGHTGSARFVGIDLSSGMLGRAKQRTAGRRDVRGFVQANVIALPFRSASFDGVCCLEVLVHLPSREALLAVLDEMHRVLKPGGDFLVSMLTNTISLRGAVVARVVRPLKRQASDLRSLHSSVWLLRRLRERGFRVEGSRGWARPVVNSPRLYWINYPLAIVDALHSKLSSVFPVLHLLKDRVVFRCVKDR